MFGHETLRILCRGVVLVSLFRAKTVNHSTLEIRSISFPLVQETVKCAQPHLLVTHSTYIIDEGVFVTIQDADGMLDVVIWTASRAGSAYFLQYSGILESLKWLSD